MTNQKGINPLIATILLLLVVLAIAGIVWTTIFGQLETTNAQIDEAGGQFAGCAGASIVATLSIYKPQVSETNDTATITVKNDGTVDLNGFNVITYYDDGSTDLNTQSSTNVAALMTVTLNASATGTVDSIEVKPINCPNIGTTVKRSQMTIS